MTTLKPLSKIEYRDSIRKHFDQITRLLLSIRQASYYCGANIQMNPLASETHF
ncbi:MAG: hypothetical protein OXC92_07070 [Flavobacteriaceae bacterium]|nr:hypothetical protein [Flavobacteriaceae bacterium]